MMTLITIKIRIVIMIMIITNNDDDINYKNNKLLQSCSPQKSPT